MRIIALLALLTCAAFASAADKKPATRPALPITTQWYSLFDGKTLRNWKPADFAGGGEIAVKDGKFLLPLPKGGDMTGAVWDGGGLPESDFEIALDAQRTDGSDFFCALTFPVGKSAASLVLGGWGGNVCGISSIDFQDAANNSTTTSHEFKKGEWYGVRMRVQKDKLLAWLDDEKIVDVVIKGKKVNTRLECEPCKPLGMATWNTAGAIRELRIRLLKPEEIKKVKDDEP